MSLELIYTSAPKGLKPGSRGFCTVAMTQGMTAQLVDRLEALSGYRQVFAPQDPQAGLNPVVCSHLRISVAGRNYHVLSRVCAAGLDYSQRTNKFAHHVVLDANELPQAGPAWLLAVPGFMATAWDQTTRLLPPRPRPPAGNSAPAVCQRWQQTTGDAGWGGVLVDAAIKNPKGLATLIFKPGQDPLPLLAESLALMPAEMRWQATFSTYYTKLPPGVECRWRCVVEGSPEAKAAAGVVIDLCRRLGQPPAGEYVTAARTGRVPIAAKPPRQIKAESPGEYELAQLLVDPIAYRPHPRRSRVRPSQPIGPAHCNHFLRRFPRAWPPIRFHTSPASLPRKGSRTMAVRRRNARHRTSHDCGCDSDRERVVRRPSFRPKIDRRHCRPKRQAKRGECESIRRCGRSRGNAKGSRREGEKGSGRRGSKRETRPTQKELAKDHQREVAEEENAKAAEAARKQVAAKTAKQEELNAAVASVKGLGDTLILPDLGSTTPHKIGTLAIPGGLAPTIDFFGTDTAPGTSLSEQPISGSPPGVDVLLHVAHPESQFLVSSFRKTDNELQFNWEGSAQSSRENASQVLNSALRISIMDGGKSVYSRIFSLRKFGDWTGSIRVQKSVLR